jgi:hypothetical protein
MPLNKQQKLLLLSEGWLPSEINALQKASSGNIGAGTSKRHVVKQDFNYSSKTFSSARRDRRRWVRDLKSLGWNDMDIKLKLIEYYSHGSGRSVYDWLKLAYAPPHKLTDYQSAIVKKIRARASRTLGKLYGRNLRTATKVRTQPKRPVVPFKPRRIIRVRRRG